MRSDKRKVAVVGTGMVGMSYAYSLLNQSVCDELTLIDINKTRAEGEAMDLNHGLAFAASNMKISAGNYSGGSGPEAGRKPSGSFKAKYRGLPFDYRTRDFLWL